MTVTIPEAVTLTTDAQTLPARARAIVIVDAASERLAGEFLKGVKALRAEIAAVFDAHIKRAHDQHRALIDEKKRAEAPAIEAEGILKAALVAFEELQERLRREEEARLQAEARAREETRRLEEAAALELEGCADEAEALLDEPLDASSVLVVERRPSASGIAYRETWSAKVVSLRKLIAFVAQHPEHERLLLPNQTALNQLARAQQHNLTIDGVQAVSTKGVAATARSHATSAISTPRSPRA